MKVNPTDCCSLEADSTTSTDPLSYQVKKRIEKEHTHARKYFLKRKCYFISGRDFCRYFSYLNNILNIILQCF